MSAPNNFTFIRPPAAALLAYSAFGAVPEHWKVGAALLAGGVALTAHGAKMSTRAVANTSPEPVVVQSRGPFR